jgi:hypothetical protein
VLGIREAREIGSHLGHQPLHPLPTHARDGLTALDLLLKRGDAALNFLFHMGDRSTLRLNQAEQFAEEKAMVLAYVSGEGCYHLFRGGLHSRTHPSGQAHRVAFSSTEPLQNGSSRHPHHLDFRPRTI